MFYRNIIKYVLYKYRFKPTRDEVCGPIRNTYKIEPTTHRASTRAGQIGQSEMGLQILYIFGTNQYTPKYI